MFKAHENIMNLFVYVVQINSIKSSFNYAFPYLHTFRIPLILVASASFICLFLRSCQESLFSMTTIVYQRSLPTIVSHEYHNSLTGNISSMKMLSSILKFTCLKFFHVDGQPRKAPKDTPIIWHPPRCFILKCNTNGAAKGC